MSSFEDERGYIRDLLGPVDAVTEILTCKGHVRGNHYHRETTHWTYIASGRLLIHNGKTQIEYGEGELIRAVAGEPHAWRALEDTLTLELKVGPGAGENYQDDLVRLEVPLL